MEEDWVEDDLGLDALVLEDVDSEAFPGIPRISFSRQEQKDLWKPWAKCLIIKVLGKSLPYNFLVQRLHLRWRIQGILKVIDIGNDYYLVHLPSWEDRTRVLTDGPWVIAGNYLSVQSWKPEFDPFKEEIRRMALWVRLPFLPFEYYNADVLFKIGNLIGKCLRIDHNTELVNRGRFARLCVEVDITKPLVTQIVIGLRFQKVEFEGIGLICFSCGCVGHRNNSCVKNEKEVDVNEVVNEVPQKVVVRNGEGGSGSGDADGWTRVQNRKKYGKVVDKGKAVL